MAFHMWRKLNQNRLVCDRKDMKNFNILHIKVVIIFNRLIFIVNKQRKFIKFMIWCLAIKIIRMFLLLVSLSMRRNLLCVSTCLSRINVFLYCNRMLVRYLCFKVKMDFVVSVHLFLIGISHFFTLYMTQKSYWKPSKILKKAPTKLKTSEKIKKLK